MPRFYQEVDAEVDVDIDDFLSACSSREIKQLINALIEDNHLKPSASKVPNESKTYLDTEWDELTDKFSEIRLRLTQEDEESLRSILKRY